MTEASLDSQLREQRWSVRLVLGTLMLGGRPSSAVLRRMRGSAGMEGFPKEAVLELALEMLTKLSGHLKSRAFRSTLH